MKSIYTGAYWWLVLLLATLSAQTGFAQLIPTSPDSSLHVAAASCKFATLGWSVGTARYHLVVLSAHLGDRMADISPEQGTALTANNYFMAGNATRNGGVAVYADTGKTVTVTGLQKGHQYDALVYGYNQSSAGTVAYQLSRVPDTLHFTTPDCPDVSPSRNATNLRCTTIDCSTFRLTCHPGNGQGRLFILRKSSTATTGTSAGDVSVQQEIFYPPSNLYARGFEITPGCYALSAGTDSTVVVYGLAPDQIYKCAVYEYNTVPGPDGKPDGSTPFYRQFSYPIFFPATGACTGHEPDKSPYDDKQHQTSNARVVPNSLTTTSVELAWHPSMTPAHIEVINDKLVQVPATRKDVDGIGSYVVIRNATSPGALPLPLQNTVPALTSSVYGQGSPVRPGQDSIYSIKLTQQWQDTTAAITGLRPGTVYTVDIFTYRYPDNGGTTPYTYFLSLPQASVSFFTPFAAPLPVQLTSFEASRATGTVQLKWVTASELNNAGFQVERSSDGSSWQTRAAVAGHGTTTLTHEYRYEEVFTQAAYYRLAQRDLGGRLTYSPVRYVAGVAAGKLSLYPNPATDTVTLAGITGTEPTYLRTIQGQLLRSYPAGQAQLEVRGLATGIYLVQHAGQTLRLHIQ